MSLAFTNPALPTLTYGLLLADQLAVSGATGAVSFAVTAGALPAGITLSPTGMLAGTVTFTGAYDFTITATDAGSGATLLNEFNGTVVETLNSRLSEFATCVAADVNNVVTTFEADITNLKNEVVALQQGNGGSTPVFIDEDLCALYSASRTAVVV